MPGPMPGGGSFDCRTRVGCLVVRRPAIDPNNAAGRPGGEFQAWSRCLRGGRGRRKRLLSGHRSGLGRSRDGSAERDGRAPPVGLASLSEGVEAPFRQRHVCRRWLPSEVRDRSKRCGSLPAPPIWLHLGHIGLPNIARRGDPATEAVLPSGRPPAKWRKTADSSDGGSLKRVRRRMECQESPWRT